MSEEQEKSHGLTYNVKSHDSICNHARKIIKLARGEDKKSEIKIAEDKTEKLRRYYEDQLKRRDQQISRLIEWRNGSDPKIAQPITLFESEEEGEIHHTDLGDIVFEAVADSGSSEHIVSPDDVEGMKITPSKMSSLGRGFITASGERVDNEGECHLNFAVGEEGPEVSTTFQVAQVTRPLLSISKMCDKGNTVTFTKQKGVVTSPDGKEICVFERDRGLYVAKVKVRRDQTFRWHGASD